MAKILIVEDEVELSQVIAKYLQAAGFETQEFASGEGVVAWVKQNKPDVILLDWNLPGQDGLSICKEICAFSEIPIIMTTAKVDEIDRLIGLEAGADDYVCKPYSAKEVVARVKVRLRRLNRLTSQEPSLQLDESLMSIRFEGTTLQLTAIEFNLFSLFYRNPRRIYSRQHIMDRVYQDYRVVSERTIDSHIRNLRLKLTQLSPDQDLIQSIYAVGYKYEPM